MKEHQRDMVDGRWEATSLWLTIDVDFRNGDVGKVEFPAFLETTDDEEDGLWDRLTSADAPKSVGANAMAAAVALERLAELASRAAEAERRERDQSARLLDSIPELLSDFPDDE